MRLVSFVTVRVVVAVATVEGVAIVTNRHEEERYLSIPTCRSSLPHEWLSALAPPLPAKGIEIMRVSPPHLPVFPLVLMPQYTTGGARNRAVSNEQTELASRRDQEKLSPSVQIPGADGQAAIAVRI